MGQEWLPCDIDIGIQIPISLLIVLCIKLQISLWKTISKISILFATSKKEKNILGVIEGASVCVCDVLVVCILLSVVACVIEERCAMINILGIPSDQGITKSFLLNILVPFSILQLMFYLVKCVFTPYICFNVAISFKMEAWHSHKHLKHWDIVLFYLNLKHSD